MLAEVRQERRSLASHSLDGALLFEDIMYSYSSASRGCQGALCTTPDRKQWAVEYSAISEMACICTVPKLVCNASVISASLACTQSCSKMSASPGSVRTVARVHIGQILRAHTR